MSQYFQDNYNYLNNSYNQSLSDIPYKLQKRMDKITQQAVKGMDKIGRSPHELVIKFNLKDISPNPNVTFKDGHILLEIPLLFILKLNDGTAGSPENQWIKEHIAPRGFSKKDQLSLGAFELFIKNPTLAKKAKKFVLYHELGHVLHNHILSPPANNKESRKREKEADLVAANLSKSLEGGIYLFDLMSNFDNRTPTTHPSFKERASYLREYQEDQKAMNLS